MVLVDATKVLQQLCHGSYSCSQKVPSQSTAGPLSGHLMLFSNHQAIDQLKKAVISMMKIETIADFLFSMVGGVVKLADFLLAIGD